MVDKKKVEQAVNEWLKDKDYFLVELTVSADDNISVVIDHAEGVWIEDCADLSRYIESQVSRDEEDYELEVGSAGLGYPFKVLQQYINHVGKSVEVLTLDGKKYQGTLQNVTEEGFELVSLEKVKEEGKKRPVQKEVVREFQMQEVKSTKYLIKIK